MTSPVNTPAGRHKDIFEWLKGSKFARSFKKGQGFYVVAGTPVRLRSGESLDIIEWLKREGFFLLGRISEHNIVYTPECEAYLKKLSFFFSSDSKNKRTRIKNRNFKVNNYEYTEFDRKCEPDPLFRENCSIVDMFHQERSSKYNDYYDYDEDKWNSYIYEEDDNDNE